VLFRSIRGTQVQVFTRCCEVGRDSRAKIPLPDLFAALGVESMKHASNATEENPITRDRRPATPHKLVALEAALKRPVQPSGLNVEGDQLIPNSDHVSVSARAEDVCGCTAIARESAGDSMFPDYPSGWPFEGVDVTSTAIGAD